MIRLRSEIATLSAYSAGRSGAAEEGRYAGKALLGSNELAFGPLPAVLEAIAAAAPHVHRYPDPEARALREAIAAQHGLTVSGVAVGTGSAEVCRQALFAVAGPGDEVVLADPTFPEYRTIATLSGAGVVAVPLVEHVHDLATMGAAINERSRAIVICNPNNPTGTALSHRAIAEFVATLPRDLLVVVDEAYAEFADKETVAGSGFVRAHDNVLVLRTFSKAYGLAGLRVGYGLGSPEVIEALSRTRVPFGVSALAQVAATASLAAGANLALRVTQVVAERARVVQGLRRLGVAVPDSQGNFCWAPFGERSADAATHLADAGVFVRPFHGALRITIGSPEENERLLGAVEEFLETNPLDGVLDGPARAPSAR
ncbi:MAG: hisC [Acidimicrobiaceae bacterium]|nr:hisC [Acidimicrobiaceae bacterium]